jgi:molecular chaperone HscB
MRLRRIFPRINPADIGPSLQQNFFDLFGLYRSFHLDLADLDAAYRIVQTQVHPDRHVTSSEAQRRLSLQWATHANEAYLTLKDPLKRAAYLCKLSGIDIDTQAQDAMSPDFLQQQIEWREAFSEAGASKNRLALDALHQEIQAEQLRLFAQLEAALEEQNNMPRAAETLRKLIFIKKFSTDLGQRLMVLGNENGTTAHR